MPKLSLRKTYKKYPQYKESSFGFISELPTDWQITKIGKEFSQKKDHSVQEEELLSVYRDYGVIPKSSRDDNFNRPSDDLSNYILIRPDDLVINKMKTWQGSIAISKYRGIVSPAYFSYKPKAGYKEKLFLPYVHHLLRSQNYIDAYKRISNGIRPQQWDLDPYQFKILPLLLPTWPVQKQIADYLDSKLSLIDQIIEKKHRLIELLKEKRTAVINQAVTKGLDPNTQMVDSGIDWIGNIPKGWRISPFKHAVCFQEGPGIMANDFREEGVPLLRIGNLSSPNVTLDGCNFVDRKMVQSKWKQFRLNAGDLLISASATTGIVSEIDKNSEGSIAYTGIIRLVSRKKKSTRDFVRFIVISSYYMAQIEILQAGAAMKHYGPSHLGKIVSAFPPISEQEKIGTYLMMSQKQISQNLELVERSIASLNEFKSSLISHVVTGKVQV